MVTESIKEITSNRPYPPPSNVILVLHRLRERNLPERIDSEYLRVAVIPDGTITRTLVAIRFLGLINEANEPTEPLKSIHTSTDEEYQKILSGLIHESYKDIFNVVDPSKDSQDRILNVFKRYKPASQRNRMVIFFLGMCREAGIPTLDIPKARPMTERLSKPSMKRGSEKLENSALKRGRGSIPIIESDINPALNVLIRSLPEPGKSLSPERLKQWLDMAGATLRFIYPENEAPTVEKEKIGTIEDGNG